MHIEPLGRMRWWIKDMERDLIAGNGVCPERIN